MYLVIKRCTPAEFGARTSGRFMPLSYTIAVNMALKFNHDNYTQYSVLYLYLKAVIGYLTLSFVKTNTLEYFSSYMKDHRTPTSYHYHLPSKIREISSI